MADVGRRWWLGLPVAAVAAAAAVAGLMLAGGGSSAGSGHGQAVLTDRSSSGSGGSAAPDYAQGKTTSVLSEGFEHGLPGWIAFEPTGLSVGTPGHGSRHAMKVVDAGEAQPVQVVTNDQLLPKGDGPRLLTADLWLRANRSMDAQITLSGLHEMDEVAGGSALVHLGDISWHETKVTVVIPTTADRMRLRITLPDVTGSKICSIDGIDVRVGTSKAP